MKCGIPLLSATLGLCSVLVPLPVVGMRSVQTSKPTQTPVARVVALLEDLRQKIEADGETEQESYNQFSCWCEESSTSLTASISDAKASIMSLEEKMKEFGAAIASLGAEIKQLEADISSN